MKFLKSKYILSHIFLCIILIALDQISKFSAVHFLSVHPIGDPSGFSLYLVKNYDLIFGLKLGPDNLFINTSLTAIFCLFVFYYIISLAFIPKSFYYLQLGISILFSGFVGNMINKLSNGYTLDFIRWSPSETTALYFNLSDVFQTVAWLLILLQIIKLRSAIFRKKEKRKSLIVIKAYQLQFIGYSVLSVLCVSSFLLLLSYQFLNFVDVAHFANINQIGSFFFKYSLFILFLLIIFISIFFLYLSNKVYGPLYAFERYIKALLNGEVPKDLQLRKNDQLKHLEDLAKDIKKSLNKSR